ncbi:Hypp2343 [Branchiostoma lanceolatum]|uniref:Hypp2343 protein n=1 Tax=Branchiostoma lanceolatum TaxID=7740 RepID=A0A8J9ZQ00_BRALA|nr:Hypp2343 [Branchiostoma lanceolatum]
MGAAEPRANGVDSGRRVLCGRMGAFTKIRQKTNRSSIDRRASCSLRRGEDKCRREHREVLEVSATPGPCQWPRRLRSPPVTRDNFTSDIDRLAGETAGEERVDRSNPAVVPGNGSPPVVTARLRCARTSRVSVRGHRQDVPCERAGTPTGRPV